MEEQLKISIDAWQSYWNLNFIENIFFNFPHFAYFNNKGTHTVCQLWVSFHFVFILFSKPYLHIDSFFNFTFSNILFPINILYNLYSQWKNKQIIRMITKLTFLKCCSNAAIEKIKTQPILLIPINLSIQIPLIIVKKKNKAN